MTVLSPVLVFPDYSAKSQGCDCFPWGCRERTQGTSHPGDCYPTLGTFLLKAGLSVAAATPDLCSYLLDFMASHGSCSPCAHFTSQNLSWCSIHNCWHRTCRKPEPAGVFPLPAWWPGMVFTFSLLLATVHWPCGWSEGTGPAWHLLVPLGIKVLCRQEWNRQLVSSTGLCSVKST